MSTEPADVPLFLPYNWRARAYQMALWNYLRGGGKRATVIAHRRWGKDEIGLHHGACSAFERVANYCHMLPFYAQARKALWDAVNPHTGIKRIDEAFPLELRARTREQEMSIEFINKSTWQLAGSDNYDALMGTSYAGIVESEYALGNPSAHSYFSPILRENDGWSLIITTPRGHNHAEAMYKTAKKGKLEGKDYYAELAPASKTGVFSPSELDDELAEMQHMHGDQFGKSLFLQEYEVSFDAAIPGSVWGDCLDKLQQRGMISRPPFDPAFPVFTAWDLGRTDATAIWWFQMFANEVRILRYHESSLKDIPFYCDLLRSTAKSTGYIYGTHWLPHDARARTLAAGGKSIQQQMISADVGRIVIAPRLDHMDGIQAARATFPHCWIHEEDCAQGVEMLRNYHYEWDEVNRVFTRMPVHDFSCVVGETKVLTRYVTQRIMDLPSDGEVMTSCGWKPYINARKTRTDAPLVEVRFRSGYTVKCTPDHLFLTEKGWRYAAHLRRGSLIRSGLIQSPNILMAAFTVYGLVLNILRVVERDYIGMCGRLLSGIFQRPATFTTRTQTQSITNFQILSAWKQPSIATSLGKKRVRKKDGIWRDKKSLGNTPEVQRAEPQIVSRQNKVSLGKSGHVFRWHVYTVLESFVGCLEKLSLAIKNIAAPPAKWLPIESVSVLKERADVYCLEVPSNHEFALENGAIVHNSHGSSAFRTLALCWKANKDKAPQGGDNASLQAGLLAGSIRAQSFGALRRRHFAKGKRESKGLL